MTDVDLGEFMGVFQDLQRVFAVRSTQQDTAHTMRLYFNALRAWPIEDIQQGATKWMSSGTRFPRPVEWIAQMPPAAPAWVPPLADDEAAEHRKAMRQAYKADPCKCYLCQKAGVSDRLLRFVPDFDDGDAQGQVVLDGRVVSRGHWAHGTELRDWYAARDGFFAKLRQMKPRVMSVDGPEVPKGTKIEKVSIYEAIDAMLRDE